ncbi:phosphoprotein phosphatase protein [Perkinsela sp. CCAP 1560/4]|nr:phosphoprotein phosphatase protein [Perkinsela sp. CCAP 1560/4]|eukprot:KNH06075.1 phosphoprotein phosphatase protein [Perkinsela sp. CCAP 1560/4]
MDQRRQHADRHEEKEINITSLSLQERAPSHRRTSTTHSDEQDAMNPVGHSVDQWFMMNSDLYETLMSIESNRRARRRPSIRSAETEISLRTNLYEIARYQAGSVLIRSQTGEEFHAPVQCIYRHISEKPFLKLLLIDMNGVIVDRTKKNRSFAPRPGIDTFFKRILSRFAVGIWTSAIKKNALICLKKVLPEEIRQNVFLFLTREHCTVRWTPENPYGTIKNLSLLWDNPRIYGKWDQTNSLLIDDSVEKTGSHPENVIIVPSFTKADKKDVFLESFGDFLLHVLYLESDIRGAARKWKVRQADENSLQK